VLVGVAVGTLGVGDAAEVAGELSGTPPLFSQPLAPTSSAAATKSSRRSNRIVSNPPRYEAPHRSAASTNTKPWLIYMSRITYLG
jgi:hypothetical protein